MVYKADTNVLLAPLSDLNDWSMALGLYSCHLSVILLFTSR